MNNILTPIAILVIFIIFTGCTKEKNDPQVCCSQQVIISENQYGETETENLTINNAEIIGNCLKINFSASGCSGNSWDVKLIASEAIMKSNPPKRTLKLSLRNEEFCEAYITKELAFDLSNLQDDGDSIWILIANYDEELLYQY